LNKLIKNKNIINFARVQKLGWNGHIERMQETRMDKEIQAWKPISMRPIWIPKTRFEENVKKIYTEVKREKMKYSCPG